MQIHAYALARRAQIRAEFRRYGIGRVDATLPIVAFRAGMNAARLPSRSPQLVPVDTLEVSASGRLAALRACPRD